MCSSDLVAATPRAFGAYVDLGNNVSVATTPVGTPTLSGTMQPKSQLNGGITTIYDTWSLYYEFNGLDEDHAYGADQGGNGIDDDENGFVDDGAERETAPPFPQALRGIEIRVRCYEPSSRQVRQVTVRHTFVPH